jgi:hypothetical protein
VNGNSVVYYDNSKQVGINPTDHDLYLNINGTNEYSQPRTETGAVVSIAAQQNIHNNISLADMSSLSADLAFQITENNNLMTGTQYNKAIHTAQFQMRLRIQNLNKNSAGYGDYYYFILPIYDARYDYAPKYDNGYNNGDVSKKYICNIGAASFLSEVIAANQSYQINVGLLNKINNIFNEAQDKGYLTNCTWEDMFLSSYDLTLAIPGTFNLGVFIDNLDLNYTVNTSNGYADENYDEGFAVYTTEEGNGAIVGTLKYDDNSSYHPVWTIAQWNSVNNLAEGYKIIQDNLCIWGDMSKQVFVNKADNSLGLLMNASSEYTSNRTTGQPWPCLLLNQEFSFDNDIKVSNIGALFLNVDFVITKMENHMVGTPDDNLHAAQLLWYITVQNRNVASEDFGKYIWFGLQLYDTRYDFPPLYAQEDAGKEQNTGMFIYNPSSMDYLTKPVDVNVNQSINYNAYQKILEAFELAQSRGYLSDTTIDDLYIGGMNIGWELPGTYDVTAIINDLNIYPVY